MKPGKIHHTLSEFLLFTACCILIQCWLKEVEIVMLCSVTAGVYNLLLLPAAFSYLQYMKCARQ